MSEEPKWEDWPEDDEITRWRGTTAEALKQFESQE